MLFANNCNTTLSGSLTNVATTMSVTSATGFPSPAGSQYFYCTLADAATQTTIEIVKVTAVSGTTFTIVRGQDGTSGTAFASGAVVSLRLVRASLNDFPKLDEANTFTFAPTFNTALAVGSGGTGLTTLTAGYIPYGNDTGAFSSSSSLYFDGSKLGVGTSTTTYGTLTVYAASVPSIALTDAGVNNSYGGIVKGYGAAGLGGHAELGVLDNGTYTKGILVGEQAGYVAFYTGSSSGASTEKMRVFASGGVSIGNTTDPGAGNLSLTSTGNALLTMSSSAGAYSSIFTLNSSSGGSGQIKSPYSLVCITGGSGGVYLASGGVAWLAYSDETLKTDLTPIENALDKISRIRSVTGRYKTDKEGTSRAFFIAQDLEKEFPQVVSKNSIDGTLMASYTETAPLLLAAINELQTKFDAYVASHP